MCQQSELILGTVAPLVQAYEEESDAETPSHKQPSPTKVVASAGLVGFNVAQDLLALDFSTPEEAPEEFRAMPFNSQKSVEVKPGLSGMYVALFQQFVLYDRFLRHDSPAITASEYEDQVSDMAVSPPFKLVGSKL